MVTKLLDSALIGYGNVGYYVPYANSAFFADQYINWWMDPTKAPLAS